MRSDTKRNRKHLIRAAVKLFAKDGPSVSMTEIAREAEVSPATAYRHFPSVEDILVQFRFNVGDALLEFSEHQAATGVDLLRTVSAEWIRLVVEHGVALVHTRSPRGYLERLREGTGYLDVQARALRRPIHETTREMGLPDIGDEAVFFWNVFFDPREILDLLGTLELSQREVNDRLVEAYLGSLRGWVSASTTSPSSGAR